MQLSILMHYFIFIIYDTLKYQNDAPGAFSDILHNAVINHDDTAVVQNNISP